MHAAGWWPGAPSQRSPGRFPPPGNLAAAQISVAARPGERAACGTAKWSFVSGRAHWVTARKTIRKRAVNSLGRGTQLTSRPDANCVVASARMRLCLMIEGQEDVTWPQWIHLAETCERVGL